MASPTVRALFSFSMNYHVKDVLTLVPLFTSLVFAAEVPGDLEALRGGMQRAMTNVQELTWKASDIDRVEAFSVDLPPLPFAPFVLIRAANTRGALERDTIPQRAEAFRAALSNALNAPVVSVDSAVSTWCRRHPGRWSDGMSAKVRTVLDVVFAEPVFSAQREALALLNEAPTRSASVVRPRTP